MQTPSVLSRRGVLERGRGCRTWRLSRGFSDETGLPCWGVSKPAIPWRQTQWQDSEGEPPFEETRNLSSR